LILQGIGAGFFIVPLLGLVESIAIGKAFGKFEDTNGIVCCLLFLFVHFSAKTLNDYVL